MALLMALKAMETRAKIRLLLHTGMHTLISFSSPCPVTLQRYLDQRRNGRQRHFPKLVSTARNFSLS